MSWFKWRMSAADLAREQERQAERAQMMAETNKFKNGPYLWADATKNLPLGATLKIVHPTEQSKMSYWFKNKNGVEYEIKDEFLYVKGEEKSVPITYYDQLLRRCEKMEVDLKIAQAQIDLWLALLLAARKQSKAT